ncbi:MAG: hypothetical protein GY810_30920 [Aureispira sp.]|nr:hypothetical protein [Aureispira sp.]
MRKAFALNKKSVEKLDSFQMVLLKMAQIDARYYDRPFLLDSFPSILEK